MAEELNANNFNLKGLKPINGYNNVYAIDTYGNVYRILKTQGGKVGKLKWRNINGYASVKLRKNGKSYNCYVHRLVAETFLPNPDNKPYVDHIDTNKQNNHISNLQYVTALENSNNPLTREHQKNAIKKTWERENYKSVHITKTKQRWTDEDYRQKIKNSSIKAHNKPVKCIELNIIFNSVTEASQYINGDRSFIGKACNGVYETAYGYHWTFEII